MSRPTRSGDDVGIAAIPYLTEKLDYLRSKSDGHRWWRTHRNPYGCWICELIDVAEECLSIAKSTQSNVVRDTDEGRYQEPSNRSFSDSRFMPDSCRTNVELRELEHGDG